LVAIVFACDFVFSVCGGYGCEGEGALIIFFGIHVFLVFFCDTNFVVIMNSTPPPPCIIAAGTSRLQYCF
jgi:hypothetical protein